MTITSLLPLHHQRAYEGYFVQAKERRGWPPNNIYEPIPEWSTEAIVDEILSIQIAAIEAMIAELDTHPS
jgi:hypothetical protein